MPEERIRKMFCPNCGKENPDGVAFCGGCGMTLAAAAAPTAPAPEAAPAAPVESAPDTAPAAPVPEAAPAAEAAPEAAPAAPAAPAAQPAPEAKPKEPSSMLPFGDHFKNIFKAATHPLTGPAEIAPQYEKIGNALILTAIVVVVISVISSCIDIPMYLIRIARYKEELSSRTFRELYGAGEIAWQIVKYSVYPFIYYAIRTFGMAGVFMLAGLILKENFSFPRLLAIASLSVAPAYLVSEVCTSIFGLIPYVRFGSIFSVATYAYFLIMLFEGMRAETKLKGNKYGFVFIICLTIVGYVAGFF